MDWHEKLRLVLARHHPAPTLTPARELSCVLVPIGWNRESGRDEILLTKRTMLVETHKGQVSFPGGYCESDDCTLVDTALRESQEEIGTKPSDIEILGALPTVTTRGSVTIFPWVGRLGLPYPFAVNAAEVERLLALPLERLIQEGTEPVNVDVGGLTMKSTGIVVDGELVWGATARVLELLRESLLG